MPKKKRTLNLKQYQGSSAVASSTRSSAGQDGGDSPTATVNERLNDLRLADSFEAVQKKRDLAEQSGQKSVPPELRSILGVPESAPPKPKAGARVRDREMQRERWRTPGPAAPRSWLGFTSAWESAVAERRARRKGQRGWVGDADRRRPEELFRFEKLIDVTETKSQPKTRSQPTGLLHLTLKRLAEHWHEFDEEDYPTLVDIPLRLRLKLLSYIGFYGPQIDSTALQALLMSSSGSFTSLDLAGLAGHGQLTIKRLVRLSEPTKRLSLATSNEVLDSWDTESTSEASPHAMNMQHLPTFTSLTHLCLSHPPQTASWRDLLALTKHTPHLTHLSLAYWPRPTLTPNLATATVTSQHSPDVRAGGTHYYSHSLDGDYSEAALLLRQLSGNLLSLRCLDLEGCTEWTPALGALTVDRTADGSMANGDGWDRQPGLSAESIFAGAWMNLSYLRIAQPAPLLPKALGVAGLDFTGFVDQEIWSPLLKFLHTANRDDHVPTDADDVDEVVVRQWVKEARAWLDREGSLLSTAGKINLVRAMKGGGLVMIDFGWIRGSAHRYGWTRSAVLGREVR